MASGTLLDTALEWFGKHDYFEHYRTTREAASTRGAVLGVGFAYVAVAVGLLGQTVVLPLAHGDAVMAEELVLGLMNGFYTSLAVGLAVGGGSRD